MKSYTNEHAIGVSTIPFKKMLKKATILCFMTDGQLLGN